MLASGAEPPPMRLQLQGTIILALTWDPTTSGGGRSTRITGALIGESEPGPHHSHLGSGRATWCCRPAASSSSSLTSSSSVATQVSIPELLLAANDLDHAHPDFTGVDFHDQDRHAPRWQLRVLLGSADTTASSSLMSIQQPPKLVEVACPQHTWRNSTASSPSIPRASSCCTGVSVPQLHDPRPRRRGLGDLRPTGAVTRHRRKRPGELAVGTLSVTHNRRRGRQQFATPTIQVHGRLVPGLRSRSGAGGIGGDSGIGGDAVTTIRGAAPGGLRGEHGDVPTPRDHLPGEGDCFVLLAVVRVRLVIVVITVSYFEPSRGPARYEQSIRLCFRSEEHR